MSSRKRVCPHVEALTEVYPYIFLHQGAYFVVASKRHYRQFQIYNFQIITQDWKNLTISLYS